MEKLHVITTQNSMKELKECDFYVACDVQNPLCGDKGCSRVFATPAFITQSGISLKEAMSRKVASENMKNCVEQVFVSIKGEGYEGILR